jgi:cysteine protease avirulence protein AvrRpt2
MADILLQVPLVGQQVGYDGRPSLQPDASGRLVRHGHMACWYASACMVSYYFRKGPRLGLPPIWKADQGLSIVAIDALAKVEGLQQLGKPINGITADFISTALATRGPIWAAIHSGRYGHAIVLTGIKSDVIYYNDPWEPSRKRNPISWLKSNLLMLPNALLVKDKSRS